MAINPITVSRLKTFVVLGHSNADGWAPTDEVFDKFAHLNPRTLTARTEPLEAYWDNCYVATSEQPYPSPYGTPIASDVGDVQWLEMTIANTLTPAADHPHPSPFQFPNNQGACYPHYYYYAYDSSFSGGFDSATPANPGVLGVRSGIEIPLMWLWRHHWGEQVGMVKMAFSSSFMMAADASVDSNVAAGWLDGFAASQYTPGDPNYVRSAVYANPTVSPLDSNYRGDFNFLAWWTPGENFDWAVHTNRLYGKWHDKMVGAQAALPTGTKMDVRLVVLWMGDNEALSGTQAKLAGFKQSAIKLIKQIRADLVANDWTTLPADQIAIVLPGAHFGYPSSTSPEIDSVKIVNDAWDEIAADDEMIGRVDPDGWSTLSDDGISLLGGIPVSTNHFGPTGYRQAAEDVFSSFLDMTEDYFDALDQEEVKTVAETKSQVKVYYAKNTSTTDLTDTILLQHINAAMFHIFNHVGDNAWWLRKSAPLTISGGTNTITTLPRYVKRLLKIRHPSDPTYPVHFEMVGHGQGGKMQIRMNERGTGSYVCDFIANPRELTSDTQIVPAPRQVHEWIVVETCRRIAGASNNSALVAHFAGEAALLMADCMRNSGQTQRAKHDVMRTQRRRPRFGYGRGGRSAWWGTDSSL